MTFQKNSHPIMENWFDSVKIANAIIPQTQWIKTISEIIISNQAFTRYNLTHFSYKVFNIS